MRPWLSVVIPARNDASALAGTLDRLTTYLEPGSTTAEIIVAASGDPEGTRAAVRGRARVLWPDGSTRASLMNAGAEAAAGDVLLFLHADSLPPEGLLDLVRRALVDPAVAGGAFTHQFAESVWSLRAMSALNRVRYHLTRIYYGDQGIFVRAPVFRALGGYRDLTLMEDIDLSRRLKRAGRTVIIPAPVVTSGRRFLARGPWRTAGFGAWLLLLYTLRLDTQRYAERWRGPADQTPGASWPRPSAASTSTTAVSASSRISIVVPILNEVEELPELIDSLRALGGETEVLFVDGGSVDGGPALARAAGYRLLTSAPGRARQMNAGARAARGDVLLFLHADARLSPAALEAARAAMRDPAVVAGRFDLVYDTTRWPYPWIARLGNVRSRLTRIFTGDQTIFVRRQTFDAVGGYPDIALMEDIELSRRVKRLGPVACLRARVRGSTRKCRREGVWRTVALMWLLRTLYALGAPPARLHRLYYRQDPGKRLTPQAPGPMPDRSA